MGILVAEKRLVTNPPQGHQKDSVEDNGPHCPHVRQVPAPIALLEERHAQSPRKMLTAVVTPLAMAKPIASPCPSAMA